MKTTEDILEQTTLAWFENLGYNIEYGPDIAFDGSRPERDAGANYADVILGSRLREALERINPDLPFEAIEEAIRKITLPESPSLIENNRTFHKMLTDGIPVEYRREPSPLPSASGKGRSAAESAMDDYGEIVHGLVWLLDLEDLSNNDWLAVNQFTVVENKRERRPDVVVFVNGLPMAVIELKNPADDKATIRHAFNQLQTYKEQISALFTYNELLVISDGLQACSGTLTAGWDRFMPWRTVDGETIAPKGSLELEVLLKGIFDKKWLLDYVLNFITFEDEGGDTSTIAKKAAGYHQYHAVNKAVECTLSACGIKAPRGLVYGRFLEAEAADPFPPVREDINRPYGSGSSHGFGQKPFHGFLCREGHSASCNGKPDNPRCNRPERLGRPALWDVFRE